MMSNRVPRSNTLKANWKRWSWRLWAENNTQQCCQIWGALQPDTLWERYTGLEWFRFKQWPEKLIKKIHTPIFQHDFCVYPSQVTGKRSRVPLFEFNEDRHTFSNNEKKITNFPWPTSIREHLVAQRTFLPRGTRKGQGANRQCTEEAPVCTTINSRINGQGMERQNILKICNANDVKTKKRLQVINYIPIFK